MAGDVTASEDLPKSEDSLEVQWNLEYPPVKPTSKWDWQMWQPTSGGQGGFLKPDQEIEAGLTWPQGTLAALREAFRLGLDRKVAWTVGRSDLHSSPSFDALKAAARVFKRGVAFQSEGQVGLTSALHGSYRINLARSGGFHEKVAVSNALVLVDQNVAQHWGLISGAGEGPTQVKSAAEMPLVPYEWDQTCSILTIVSGEQNKTLETAARIVKAWRQHLKSHTDRDSAPYLFVIGGGLLGDIAAFAAGLVGAPVTLVPTTLLAMVDACVGGKTGVNFSPFGKNQVGLFYFPQEVNVWSGWLKTLPIREWRSGIMECLKHALLVSSGPGQPLFVKIEEIINTYSLEGVNDSLLDIIKVKSDVVGKDPGEKGERAILNFGHTLGHALEAKSHLKAERTANPFSPHLLHGEAVGLGMLFALELSQIVCGLAKSEANYLNRLIKKGLSFGRELKSADILAMLGATSWDDPDLWSDLVQMMAGDKKNQGMSIHWVLIRGIGQPLQPQLDQWTTAVDLATMKKAWDQFLLDLRQL